jgi:hypothetical protein
LCLCKLIEFEYRSGKKVKKLFEPIGRSIDVSSW